jgi:hypothetical protein
LSGASRALLALSLAAWLVPAGCSLVVDPGELQKGCAAGSKPCEVAPGQFSCVSVTDPEYGCARESCVPCTLPHAIEVCGGDGECAVGTCLPEFQNCDLVAKNGCEVDLETSYDDCGDCGASCSDDLRSMPRALSAQCQGGRCLVDECKDGYADCDLAATNGCEKALPDESCGRCTGCPGMTTCNLETKRCE